MHPTIPKSEGASKRHSARRIKKKASIKRLAQIRGDGVLREEVEQESERVEASSGLSVGDKDFGKPVDDRPLNQWLRTRSASSFKSVEKGDTDEMAKFPTERGFIGDAGESSAEEKGEL